MQKNKFSSNKQYLCGLLFSGNLRRTDTDQCILHFLYSFVKRNDSQALVAAATFFQVCMLLIWHASMNDFNSM